MWVLLLTELVQKFAERQHIFSWGQGGVWGRKIYIFKITSIIYPNILAFQNGITFCTESYESNFTADTVKAGILLFRPNVAQKGLDLGSQLKLWKSIKWAFSMVLAWNWVYVDSISPNFFRPKNFFLASEVVKIEKSSYFVQKMQKTWFCTKKVKKTGENMLCQLKSLLSNMIHWFMHKNHVYNDLSWVIWCILLYFCPKMGFLSKFDPP